MQLEDFSKEKLIELLKTMLVTAAYSSLDIHRYEDSPKHVRLSIADIWTPEADKAFRYNISIPENVMAFTIHITDKRDIRSLERMLEKTDNTPPTQRT
jgi:hypothetical protein